MNNYMKTIISGLKQWVSSQKSDWNQNDSSAANFVKNRPFYSEQKEKILFSKNVSVENFGDDVYGAEGLAYGLSFTIGQIYRITFDNVEYSCECFYLQGLALGNASIVGEGADSGEPFIIGYNDDWGLCLYCLAEGTHSLSISGTVEEVHQIDKKYVPMPELADVAHTGDYDDLRNTPYIPWDTVQYATSQSLTDGNKQIARNNIGAASATDVNSLNTSVSNLNTLVGDTAVSTQIENATDECVTGMSVSGKVITYTKGDGSTGKITTQDTTYNITNGKSTGSLRGTGAAYDTSDYTLGQHSFAFGLRTQASGSYATAFGCDTKASGNVSHAEGNSSVASSYGSHAEGAATVASGNTSHAEGAATVASGDSSHAEGTATVASGAYSHAEGWGTIAASDSQHVQGAYNIEDASYKYTHIVGNGTSDIQRSNAHTLSRDGVGWFKGGLKVGGTGQDDLNAKEVALKSDSITELSASGKTITYTKGDGSTGTITTQDTTYSIATTSANGLMSFSDKGKLDGLNIINNLTDGYANGAVMHGFGAEATGVNSYAGGRRATAAGENSHAEGLDTITFVDNQHVQGKYNVDDGLGRYAHIVGNGSSDTERSNAHTISWEGVGWFRGGLQVGGEYQGDPDAVEVALKSDLASLSAPTAISLTRIDEICNQTIYSTNEVTF